MRELAVDIIQSELNAFRTRASVAFARADLLPVIFVCESGIFVYGFEFLVLENSDGAARFKPRLLGGGGIDSLGYGVQYTICNYKRDLVPSDLHAHTRPSKHCALNLDICDK